MSWQEEFDNFIAHWEEETRIIRDKTLELEECHKISSIFREDQDALLMRRPPGVSEEIFLKLEELENKLNSTLAMACTFNELGKIGDRPPRE
jgi:hypothetical protein